MKEALALTEAEERRDDQIGGIDGEGQAGFSVTIYNLDYVCLWIIFRSL
jgi:hypothetical protein